MPTIRTALRLDALASGGLGALLLALANVLDGPLGLPTTLSAVIGAMLLAWAVFLAWVSTTNSVSLVVDVVLLNVVWIATSAVFAFAGWIELTGLGVTFVLAQAVAVAGLTELQVLGLRRRRTVAAVI